MLDHKVLSEINALEESHCMSCEDKKGKISTQLNKTCKACPIGKEIQKLGRKLEITKTQQVLLRGKDMTFEDICFCIANGVDQEDIKKAAGLNRGKTFKAYMNRHGRDTWGRKLVN